MTILATQSLGTHSQATTLLAKPCGSHSDRTLCLGDSFVYS